MIPLCQSTTLLSYTRQALHRPARLYSTPSTTRHNAYLAQPFPPQPELPPYLIQAQSQKSKDTTVPEDVHNFLVAWLRWVENRFSFVWH